MRASFIRRVETRRLITSNRNRGGGVSSDLARRILQSYTDMNADVRECICAGTRCYTNLLARIRIVFLLTLTAALNFSYAKDQRRLCLVLLLNALLNS